MRSVDSNNRDLYAFEVLEINLDLVNGDIDELIERDTQIVSCFYFINNLLLSNSQCYCTHIMIMSREAK